ncbi:hypothetical protein D3C87_1758850 [compost metagenome]
MQSASTFALSELLNMSPTIVMPPWDHWPMPPRSGWLNCAWLPLPAITATSRCATAAVLTPWRCAISLTILWPSSLSGLMVMCPSSGRDRMLRFFLARGAPVRQVACQNFARASHSTDHLGGPPP